MSERKASTKKKARRYRAQSAEEHQAAQAAIWGELQLFLAGLDAHRVPNEEQAECRIWNEISQVLDHDLIKALKRLYQHYLYNPPLNEIDAPELQGLWPVQNLLNLLEEYQMSRLRVLLDGAHGLEAAKN